MQVRLNHKLHYSELSRPSDWTSKASCSYGRTILLQPAGPGLDHQGFHLRQLAVTRCAGAWPLVKWRRLAYPVATVPSASPMRLWFDTFLRLVQRLCTCRLNVGDRSLELVCDMGVLAATLLKLHSDTAAARRLDTTDDDLASLERDIAFAYVSCALSVTSFAVSSVGVAEGGLWATASGSAVLSSRPHRPRPHCCPPRCRCGYQWPRNSSWFIVDMCWACPEMR